MNLHCKKADTIQVKTWMPSPGTTEKRNKEDNYLRRKINICKKNIRNIQTKLDDYERARAYMAEQYKLLFELEKKLFADLFNVGVTKCMGYLPKNLIIQGGRDYDYFIEFAIKNNLEFYIATATENIGERLYIFDRKKLNILLKVNSHILEELNFPVDVDFFVEYVANGRLITFEENNNWYTLVAMSFNDFRLSAENIKNR